eukprot:m.172589 g.172589  ORF g.172589 m.172589 type:complete len:553 (-) comp31696_c0_seq1:129-1787(-)
MASKNSEKEPFISHLQIPSPPAPVKKEKKTGNLMELAKKLWFQIKVLFALFGGVLFWLGAWNLEQYDCVLGPTAQQCLRSPASTTAMPHSRGWDSQGMYESMSPTPALTAGPNNHARVSMDDSFDRGLFTTSAGFLAIILSDTLYGNAGLDGGIMPSVHTKPQNWCQWVVLGLRLIVGLLGTTAVWSGMYSMLQSSAPGKQWTLCRGLPQDPDFCERDMVIHMFTFLVGIFVLVLTGTYNNTTYLYPSSDEPNFLQKLFFFYDAEDPQHLTCFDHFRYCVRAPLSLFGQTLLWFSSTRALDLTTSRHGDTVWRPLFFAALGATMLVLTNSFVEQSFIEVQDEIEEEERRIIYLMQHDPMAVNKEDFEAPRDSIKTDPTPLQFYTTSFISLCGQLIFQYGAWEAFDSFIFATATCGNKSGQVLEFRSTELNLMMVLIGAVLLALSGVLLSNASVSLSPVAYTTPFETVEPRTCSALPDSAYASSVPQTPATFANDKDNTSHSSSFSSVQHTPALSRLRSRSGSSGADLLTARQLRLQKSADRRARWVVVSEHV